MPSLKKKKWKRPDIHLSDIRKIATLNIGTMLFGALFIYMLISVIMYLTATHITSYQVTSGPLSRNQTYTALILRSEQLVESSTAGSVTYYARDNSKVKKEGAVYSVGSGQAPENGISLTDEQLSQVRSSIATFANGFDSNNFYDTYSFKYGLEGSLVQYSGNTAAQDQSDSASASSDSADGQNVIEPQTIGGETVNYAPADGLIQFTSDGYEEVTEDTLTEEHFNQKSYQQTNLRKEQVDVGDAVYKLITSEEWSLYIPLTDTQVVSLAGRDTIRVRFVKDGITQTGDFTLLTRDDGYFAKITFSSGMIRYASDRFLEIELVTNTETGLKIPLSAIVNKDFYVIPEGYETTGGESDEIGFLKETSDGSGESSTEFVSTTVYAQQDGYYYVDMTAFSEGDVLVKPNSTERYTIGDTMPLEGVYSTNRGYAVFRRISIIDQNEEYCIVESGTDYGIALYDNIVYDSSTVKEEEILY